MTIRSPAFTPEAQQALDRYLARVNAVLRVHPSVNANEVEQEIRAHIEAALSAAPAPITASALDGVIQRLGNPSQWIPDEALPAWCRPLVRFRFGSEDWRAAYLTFALFVAGMVTSALAIRTYWTATGAEMLVLVGLRTSLLAAVLLLASVLLARATLTLLVARGEPVYTRRWLVYPPLTVAYGVMAVAVFVLPPAPMLMAADPTFRSEAVAWFPEPFPLRLPLLVAVATGAWWATLGAAAARCRSVVHSVFWPFIGWFDRRHGIRIACVGLTIAAFAGVGLVIVVGS